jgi:hypothetical protein
MKAKLTFALLCYCLNFSMILLAQTEPNQKLYWDYRDRLKKTFMKIGADKGESLPMEWFDFDADCRGVSPTNKGVIHWADGMTYLGDYLGVLATEYRLLKNSNQDVTGTLSELYYALNAINRVDGKGERYLSQNDLLPVNMNGFFIRDDVGPGFKDHWIDRFSRTQDRRDDVTAVSSSYGKEIEIYGCTDFPNGYFNQYNEESQDQLFYLVQGLALVKKLVDNVYVKPMISDDGFFIVDEAKSIATRLSDYVFSEKDFSLPFDPSVVNSAMLPLFLPAVLPLLLTLDPMVISSISASLTLPAIFLLTTDDDLDFYNITYTIKNPVRDSLVASGGGWVQPFAYPFTECIKFITGRNIFPPVKADVHLQNTTHQVSMPVSGYPKDWWNSFRDHTGDFKKFIIDCGPLGDLKIDMDVLFGSDYNRYMTLLLASVSNTWTGTQIHDHGAPDGMMTPELVNAVLYDHVTPNPDPNYYKSFLDNAPCEGPSEFASNNWNHPNRWSSPSTIRTGFYNGMDYMLFYNLYRLKFESDFPGSFTAYTPKNSCPCTFSTVINGTSMTFGSTQIIELNVSGNNHDLLLNQITVCPPFLNGTENEYADKGITTSDYLSHNLTIQAGGKMTVLSELVVCNNSELKIENTDGLVIGDGAMAGSILRVRSGSTLRLKAGSKIIVNNKAKIIIEPGGNFIYEPGAFIELNGNEAFMDVQDLNTSITLGSNTLGFYLQTAGGITEGGTLQLAGGNFTMNAGANLYNTNCKLQLQDGVVFKIFQSVNFWLYGENSLVDVYSNATISIENGNTIYIKGYQNSKCGELYLRNGIFRIKGGGRLLSQQCNLHLGANVDFSYQHNAILELNGDDALVDIGGDLFLENDATFGFTWDHNNFNSGYIRMSAPPYWNSGGSTNIWCQTNCRFDLEGASQSDKILEIAQESLYDPTCAAHGHGDLMLFKIVAGTVVFAGGPSMGFPDGARLALAGPCWLSNVHFKNRDPETWRYIILFGQDNVFLTGDVFEGADAGIIAALYGGHRLNVSYCDFKNCAVGMYKSSGGVNLIHNKFNQCGKGYNSLGGTFKDHIDDNEINDCITLQGIGLDLELGTTGSQYDLTNNKLHGNDTPLRIEGGNVNARCNTITENLFTALEISNNGNLNMNTTRGAGYNDFSNNNLNNDTWGSSTMWIAGGGFLDMQDGYNDLTPYHGYCIPASSFCSSACRNVFGDSWIWSGPTLFFPPCAYPDIAELHADHNKWTDEPPTPFALCYDHFFTADPGCMSGNIPMLIDIQDASPIAQLPVCGNYDAAINPNLSGERNALRNCEKCAQVPVSANSMMRLDSAVRFGINLMDSSVAQYAQAIDLFSQILNYPLQSASHDESMLLNLAYIYLNAACSDAIEAKQISVIPPYATMDIEAKKIITVINSEIVKAKSAGNYPKLLYSNLDLANLFRKIEMRDSAINIYNNVLSFASPEDIPMVEKWLCFVTSERDYVKGIISLDAFYNGIKVCSTDSKANRFAGLHNRQHPGLEDKQQKEISVFPNPASLQITVALRNFTGDRTLIIYDRLGKSVNEYKAVSEDEFKIDVSNYAKGIYLIKVCDNNTMLTSKIVVN